VNRRETQPINLSSIVLAYGTGSFAHENRTKQKRLGFGSSVRIALITKENIIVCSAIIQSINQSTNQPNYKGESITESEPQQ